MDVNDALSQLEEPKLLRLFRHLIDEDCGRDASRVESTPLDIPNGEVHAKLFAKLGSIQSYCALWFFQIAHIPEFLWSSQSSNELIQKRLKQAFVALKAKPKLVGAVEGKGEPHNLFRSVIPDWYPAVDPRTDYYFLTNHLCDVSEENLTLFSDYAHRLYSQIVGSSVDDHPRFGMGTPATMTTGAPGRVRSFVVDLLNSPSSYYIVARAGTLSVAAVTEHGEFMASSDGQAGTGLSLIATSTLTRHVAAGLSDLDMLINAPRASERDFQELFVQYPQLLLSLGSEYCEVRPHVCLFDSARDRLVPDWMARVQDSNVWDIIELKKPQHALLTTRGSIASLSAAAARGISGLLQYRDFFAVRANRNRFMARFGTAPYEPGLVLVIGRGRPTHRYEWAATHAGFSKVQVVSYDYVLDQARQRAAALHDAAVPRGN